MLFIRQGNAKTIDLFQYFILYDLEKSMDG